MGRSVEGTSGTRSGASHSLWREVIQREGNALRANKLEIAQIQKGAEAAIDVERNLVLEC